jgi:site-specific recombinase XerD
VDLEVENFLASHSYSDATKDSYGRIFKRILEGHEHLEMLTASELVSLIQETGWGNSLQRMGLAACRKILRWQYGAGHPALSARIKAHKPKPQRTLTIEKALELLMWFDSSTPKGARDLAMAALMLDTGLRVSEVCRLQLADVDFDRRVFQVIVKGGQWGMGVYSEKTGEYIADWLAVRKPAPGVSALFLNCYYGTALTREGLQTIVKKWGKALGIKLSPHDFRRSFATISSVFGAPSRLVQIGGRWSSIEMVEHYTRALSADSLRPFLPVDNLTNNSDR